MATISARRRNNSISASRWLAAWLLTTTACLGLVAFDAHAAASKDRSWECRAANGEIFYLHRRCPRSVAGDGVVRNAYVEEQLRRHPRKVPNAWARVRVQGTTIDRSAACRLIHAASAASRDGHLRDAQVSTYASLTGHDPCKVDQASS